ncbi:unnamed protein product [Meganyctiphanes norvegica]|uniref:BZIP domain-containing protein n=1 Tax=Meganyctiphanes norvegica TaxID=48144 RepID=A0AAV2RFL1_MEGNR
MCSTDYGMLDLLFDKDDPSKTMSDSFRNTLFTSDKFIQDSNLVKEEVIDSGIAQNIDWKMNTDWDADELLRSVLDGDVNSPMASISSLDFNKSFSHVLNTSKPSPTLSSYPNLTQVATPTLQTMGIHSADDMDAIENLVGLPFHAVMDQSHESLDLPMDSAASDSGLSSIDQQLSPAGYSVGSPDSSILDLGSPSHTLDGTMSEVSSTSDLGSLMSLGTVPGSPASTSFINTTPNSPEHLPLNGSRLIDPLGLDSGFSSPASSVTSVVSPSGSIATPSVSPMVIPISTASVRLAPAHAPVTVVNSSAALPTQHIPVTISQQAPTVLKTVLSSGQYTTSNSSTIPGQTIVVTQASKGGQPTAHLVKGGTYFKTNNASRSILLPVTVKDLNQVRTIKIISTGGNGTNVQNGRAVRTVVSTVRPTMSTSGSSTITTPVRAATLLSRDTKSLLKGATVVTTRPSSACITTSTTTTTPIGIKQENLDDDDDDDEPDPLQHTFQQIVLSDEEKRLLKKEGIQLPSHYPLTKQEERELKRIRRKIRNKISAQDSRKRKKEYIDGLEDRVKACTDENQQLQKRIRTLEQQNDNLLTQMRRFQSMVANGISGNGRSHTHASTAIMMLVLSAALFIVPSLRPQDGNDNELSMPSSKMPSTGHTRSLLVAPGSSVVPTNLEGLDEVEEEILEGEQMTITALNDHDYAPPAKKQKLSSLLKKNTYYNPPIDDALPRKGQTDGWGGGLPPDDDPPPGKISAQIMNILENSLINNISDTGGQKDNSRSIVVNLHNKTKFNRIRDDLELE